jgi:hypothetical protein
MQKRIQLWGISALAVFALAFAGCAMDGGGGETDPEGTFQIALTDLNADLQDAIDEGKVLIGIGPANGLAADGSNIIAGNDTDSPDVDDELDGAVYTFYLLERLSTARYSGSAGNYDIAITNTATGEAWMLTNVALDINTLNTIGFGLFSVVNATTDTIQIKITDLDVDESVEELINSKHLAVYIGAVGDTLPEDALAWFRTDRTHDCTHDAVAHELTFYLYANGNNNLYEGSADNYDIILCDTDRKAVIYSAENVHLEVNSTNSISLSNFDAVVPEANTIQIKLTGLDADHGYVENELIFPNYFAVYIGYPGDPLPDEALASFEDCRFSNADAVYDGTAHTYEFYLCVPGENVLYEGSDGNYDIMLYNLDASEPIYILENTPLAVNELNEIEFSGFDAVTD